ncbi:hypothetical protein MPTK1_8g15495 [Marchantia polymorpha subsp. ruderalis]|nr:hypothetical protein MARPO_0079s0063 [Marchantia polymorpha]|eukprot:PTQ34561.1 hypothetical protein MARPO_0079s0063 [Marchantia polymorpha]
MFRFTTKRRSSLDARKAMASSEFAGSARKSEIDNINSKARARLNESQCNSLFDSDARIASGSAFIGAPSVPAEEYKVPAEPESKIQTSDKTPIYSQLFDPPLFVHKSSPIAALRVIQWDDEKQMFVKTESNNESLNKDLRYTFGPLHELNVRNPKSKVEEPTDAHEGSAHGEDGDEEEDSDEARNKLEAQEALLMLAGSKDLARCALLHL